MAIDKWITSDVWVGQMRTELLHELNKKKEIRLGVIISDIIERNQAQPWDRPDQKDALRSLVSEILRQDHGALGDDDFIKDDFIKEVHRETVGAITDQERASHAYLEILGRKLTVAEIKKSIERLPQKRGA